MRSEGRILLRLKLPQRSMIVHHVYNSLKFYNGAQRRRIQVMEVAVGHNRHAHASYFWPKDRKLAFDFVVLMLRIFGDE